MINIANKSLYGGKVTSNSLVLVNFLIYVVML